ncbi:MAG: hypothetical protein ACOYKE_15530, partial [Ferruginibacter sp.]
MKLVQPVGTVKTAPKNYSKDTFAKLLKLAFSVRISKKYTAIFLGLVFNCAAMAQTIPTKSLITNLNLLNADNSTAAADGVRNDYNNRFSNAIDQYDNLKLMNINETFGTMRNGEYLATERRADIISNDTIFYRFLKSTQRSYQLEFIPINFAGTSINAVLYDS